MKQDLILAALILATFPASNATAQTPPPAPALVEPATGAALVQPMTLRWNAVVDPDGPIGNYTWQIGTSSIFSVVIASGFTDQRSGDVIPTFAQVSGLPNGTYFWRVKATQMVGGVTFSIDSPWSAVRSFTVTGLGPAPGVPTFSGPVSGSRFHPYEFFDITWSGVPGAQYYLLEADDEPTFSYPLTLTTEKMRFGTKFHAGWGNEIPNIYYRVRAVSADNVRGLPSATLNVKIINTAPVATPPTLVSPVNGATVSLPFTFDWSDITNPQIPGYDLDVDDEPNFLGTFGVLLVQNISRSDYTLVSDLPPGTYFWRVRALHGSVAGPWSPGGSFRVVASPPTPPGLNLFWLITEPGSVMGGAPTQARVTLNGPAPTGGATVRIASDLPHAEVPQNVFIPAGATDATVSPITTIPVPGAVIGNLRAAYGTSWQQSSIGLFPILFSLSLTADSIVGGSSVTGTVTLQRAAPAGGVDVSLVSSDTSLARLPSHVIVAEGETSASFSLTTSPVAVPTQILIDTGTASDGYRAPETWLILRPVGSPAAAPALSSVTLASNSILGGGSTTATVRLTGPAPAGGATVWVNGSMEGDVVTPGGSVTIPAGSTSTTFPIVAPAVNFSRWVMIQASYGTGAGMHGAVLRIDPGLPASPGILAMTLDAPSTIGGGSVRGTVGLATPAPTGGATVFLSSDNANARVPASVSIPAGNSATTFTVATSAVIDFNSASITATAGSTSKSVFLSVYPDPNAPPPGSASVDIALSGVPSSIRRGSTFTATGAVSNTGGSNASGYSVLISFSPSNAIKLQSPQTTTQSVAAVAPGGTRNISWQLRADRTGTATVTMTLRDASGAAVRTVSRSMTITN